MNPTPINQLAFCCECRLVMESTHNVCPKCIQSGTVLSLASVCGRWSQTPTEVPSESPALPNAEIRLFYRPMRRVLPYESVLHTQSSETVGI